MPLHKALTMVRTNAYVQTVYIVTIISTVTDRLLL